jgi:very-short-patch-repair endonuclease
VHPVRLLTHLGGTADRQTLLRGTTRRRLESAVCHGEVVKVARGRYALAAVPQAAKAAARLSGVASHVSAASLHDWKVAVVPERPQIIVPRNRKVDRRDRAGHEIRWRDVTSGERERRVTDPYRTVLDCARDLPFSHALAVADSALRQRDIDRDRLVELAHASPARGHARAVKVAEAATPLADNPFESVLRAISMEVAGLDLEPQVLIDDRGFRGTPDLVDRRRRLVLEADSYAYHSGRDAFERDCERYNALVLRGWTVLRFTWSQVMLRPECVRAALIAFLDGPDGRAIRVPELLWAA